MTILIPVARKVKAGLKNGYKRVLRLLECLKPRLETQKGILFIGYAEGGLGLGQSFRNLLRAAEKTTIPFKIYPYNVGIETRNIGPFFPEKYSRNTRYKANLILVAPDQIPTLFMSIDSRLIRGNYNILKTYWELPNAPDIWAKYLTDIDEIWVSTKFIKESFQSIFDGPIHVVPSPVVVEGHYSDFTRSDFDMVDDRFYFMFSFDYFSSPFRKNPTGIIQAFQQGFPIEKNENVGLIVKSVGPKDQYPEIARIIDSSVGSDARIKIIDESYSRDKVLGLINMTDAYVSLHRSEGFGLGMAEAMYLGRIVIGTDYSGNTDFLTEETGFPVPFTLRAIEPHEYLWSTGQSWAEPDIQKAAVIMRQVFDNPSSAKEKAKTGQAFIRKHYSIDTIQNMLEEKAKELKLNI